MGRAKKKTRRPVNGIDALTWETGGLRARHRSAGTDYPILCSLYTTCLRTTGSYFFISIFPVVLRLFLKVV